MYKGNKSNIANVITLKDVKNETCKLPKRKVFLYLFEYNQSHRMKNKKKPSNSNLSIFMTRKIPLVIAKILNR